MPKLATADMAEKKLITDAAVIGVNPHSIRCGAWWRLTPAWTGNTRTVKSESSQKAGVRSAWLRLKRGSGAAGPPVAGARSAVSPTSSGRRTTRSQTGRKPTTSTVVPTATQPARQSPSRIATCATIGSATSPPIWASVAIELARARRATNQLLRAP